MALLTAVLLAALSAPWVQQVPSPVTPPVVSSSKLRAIQCDHERADASSAGFNVSDLHFTCEPGVTDPVSVRRVSAQYPSAAMRAKIQGSVVVGAVIDLDGKVRDARVLKSLDSKLGLDDATLRAVMGSTFNPGTLNGKPIRVFMTFEQLFALR